MLKILQTRLQRYVNLELSDVQPEFRKARGARDQSANISWIMEKAREKTCTSALLSAKAFDCVDHNKLWKILQVMGILDNLTCIQISQEAGQMVWYSHLLKNFSQFVMIHTDKGFGIVNKAEVDVFSFAFLMIQVMLAL